MLKTKLTLAGREIPVIALDTLVIGTGCAGYNAADWLYDLGRKDIAILTEGVNIGTSRNTGSDKQTYYKLSIASDGADSVQEMAETLFSGGSVHGDTALAEAGRFAPRLYEAGESRRAVPDQRVRRVCRLQDRPRPGASVRPLPAR